MSGKASDLNGNTQDECPRCPGGNLMRPTKSYAQEQRTNQIADDKNVQVGGDYRIGIKLIPEGNKWLPSSHLCHQAALNYLTHKHDKCDKARYRQKPTDACQPWGTPHR